MQTFKQCIQSLPIVISNCKEYIVAINYLTTNHESMDILIWLDITDRLTYLEVLNMEK